MFVLTMDSPNTFPVAMAVCGSMEQALKTAELSSQEWREWCIEKQSESYCEGYMLVDGMSYKFSIVQCELTLKARSVFES